MQQSGQLVAGTVLLVASLACSGPILGAQAAADEPIILEVTWKLDSSGRGVAAGIYAQIEVLEHFQVVSCGGGALPRFETIKDGSTVTGICIKHLNGHIVHAKGHTDGEDQAPVYEYVPPMISSAGVPAPGEILTNSDGTIEIILRLEGGNPAGYAGVNSSAEESLGCDVNWFTPRITYEELRNLPTLDRTWEEPGITDPAILGSCNPGKASIHIRAAGKDEDAKVALAGCTNLAVGQSAILSAIGQPDGGSFRYWAEPSGPLSIQQAGDSATLRGQSPGRTTIFVEYTAPGGKTAKQSQPGSCVKLISVNGGAALPKIGLYDANGQRRSPVRTVPLLAEPSGDLLNFTLAQPIASVVPQGDSLQLQGTQEGKTAVQARTQCGQATGSPLALEVVPCDDDVIAQLKQQLADVRAQMDSNQKQVDQVLHDPEFDRAAREVAGDTRKFAWDTARSIVSVIGAGGKISGAAGSTAITVSSGASAASDIMSMANQLLDTMNGNIGSAAVSAGLKTISNETEGVAAAVASALSALKTLKSARDDAQKFGQDLGTLDGVADRLAELEKLRDQEMYDFNRLDKRLKGVCKYKGSGTKAPGPGDAGPVSDNPSNRPANGPPSQPSGPDTPSTTDSNSPAGPDNPPIDEPPPGEPPTTDDSTISLSIPRNHCGQGTGISSQPKQLSAGLKSLAASTNTFDAGPLASFQNSLQQWQQALIEVKNAAQLPDAQRRDQMRKLLPRVQSILPQAQAFGQAGRSFVDTIGGCSAKLPPALQSMAQKAKQPVP